MYLSEFIFIASKCALYIGKDAHGSNERIILFTEATLDICIKKKALRDNRHNKRKSKFDCIQIPSDLCESPGYHRSCYKAYTSVNRVDAKLATESVEPNSQSGIIVFSTINLAISNQFDNLIGIVTTENTQTNDIPDPVDAANTEATQHVSKESGSFVI